VSALRRFELQAGGATVPAIEAGPQGASEAVMFVHGNPGSSGDWSGLVQAVGEFARAVAVDMPGFGQARAPQGFEFHVGGYAQFLEDARTALGIERVHLVVHDFGGPFGLLWGLQHPAEWASVVLLNIGIMPGYRWHKMAKRWRTPVVGELVQAWIPRAAWRRAMQSGSPRGMPQSFVDEMYDNYDRETRATVLKLYRATPDPGSVAEEVGAAIAELHKPALVVWGAADPYVGVEFAERQREFFEVEDLVTLPESGHWAFQDDPAAVEQAVVPFLRRHVGAGAPPGQPTSAKGQAPSAAEAQRAAVSGGEAASPAEAPPSP
jgi:pimeloyl-ACP methyl ester carboxylesterase